MKELHRLPSMGWDFTQCVQHPPCFGPHSPVAVILLLRALFRPSMQSPYAHSGILGSCAQLHVRTDHSLCKNDDDRKGIRSDLSKARLDAFAPASCFGRLVDYPEKVSGTRSMCYFSKPQTKEPPANCEEETDGDRIGRDEWTESVSTRRLGTPKARSRPWLNISSRDIRSKKVSYDTHTMWALSIPFLKGIPS